VEREPIHEYVLPENTGDILLTIPPTYPGGRQPDYNPKPPLGLEYLAANLEDVGVDAVIADYDVLGKSTSEAVEDIQRLNPPVLGVTVLQRALPSVEQIHNGLRNKGYQGMIVYGGIGATLSHVEMLKHFKDPNSLIFLGESDESLPLYMLTRQDGWKEHVPNVAFFDQENGSIRRTGPVVAPDPRNVPNPDRQNYQYYTDKSGYGTFMTSRGCAWSMCTFCSNAAFERFIPCQQEVWRPRDPEDVVEELVELHQQYGTKRFKTNDPGIFGDPPDGVAHVVDLSNRIIAEKKAGKLPDDLSLMSFLRGSDVAGQKELLALMKQAGWDRLLLGIESSSNTILDEGFAKGEKIETLTAAVRDIREEGMSVVAGFMIFNPYSTLESIKSDLNFLEESDIQVTLAKSLRVFNGVPLQTMLEAEGRLQRNSPFETYHEYSVDPRVAALYYSLKNQHVFILDPIREAAQAKIWEVKSRGGSFNERVDFTKLSRTTWEMESGLLRTGLNYIENGSGIEPVRSQIRTIYNRHLPELLSNIGEPSLIREVADENTFTELTFEALDNRERDTLHEEYVWNKT